MALVKIGGIEYEVPELNFAALEVAWPFIEACMTSDDPMKGPAAGISVIAAGLAYADHFDCTKFGIAEAEALGEEQTFNRVVKFLKRKLKAKEIQYISEVVDRINEEAGLEPAPGEAQLPGEEENPSPEIAQTLSPNSSLPGVPAETGS